jgi:hypothetical protein
MPLFDFAKDFSADTNPSGPWTVGSFNHIYTGKPDELLNLPNYEKLTFTKTERVYCGAGLRGWGGISAGLLGLSPTAAGVVKNTSTAPVHGIPVGSIAVFPQNGPIVVRWIAPKDGTIDVRAGFVDLTNFFGVPEVWVLHNQDVRSPLHYQKAYARPGKAADHFAPAEWSSGKSSRYEGTILVAANDTIDFVVDPMYTVCPGHSEHPDGNATDIIELRAWLCYLIDDGFID